MDNRSLSTFSDILAPRREENSNFLWVSRKLNLALAVKKEIKPTPKSLKQDVLDSFRMQEIVENICTDGDISKAELVHQIKLILDEIGFKKNMKIIRWLGYVLAKICTRVCSGIYVNEEGMKRLKAQMGDCPVIFAPGHRSYADFILMSYLLFTFDVEIPAIAAGMDFHGMVGMGTVLRNTGAFFMRRTYNDDKVYWDTFKTYVHNLITNGELPIEFFIEGTRSRSCKSLCPKFGLLSMMLKPFFTGEVSDILIVPINISYDRVMEEKLFSFELLGVPKPKESTSGFFKSLSIIKEKYGNIYVDFAEPISVKKYFGDSAKQLNHALKPMHQQELTQDERKIISHLAYDVVRIQQNNSVLTAFNLIATIVSNNIIQNNKPFTKKELANELKWLKNVMVNFGALVSTDYENIDDILVVHKNLLILDGDVVNLLFNDVDLSNVKVENMKGHALSSLTMRNVIPMMMLQIYANPCLHFLANASIITIILRCYGQKGITKDKLFGHFQFLRDLFSFEFVFHKKWENVDFERTLKHLNNLKILKIDEEINFTSNEKLSLYLCNILLPFFTQYHCICYYLQRCVDDIEQVQIMKHVQEILENAITTSKMFVHPYCLNLDSLGICLQSLTQMKVLELYKTNGNSKYKVNIQNVYILTEKLSNYSHFYKIPMTITITSKL